MKSVNENIPVISLLWKCILHLYLDYCIIIPFFGGGGRGEWRGSGGGLVYCRVVLNCAAQV